MHNPYQMIGGRIRKIRLSKNVSQEKLAELSGFSVTHMSHIENGSTKLSLMAMIRICNALEVNADMILCDCVAHSEEIIKHEFTELLNGCDEKQLRVIVDLVQAAKLTLEKIY